jgi:hypothetical protein
MPPIKVSDNTPETPQKKQFLSCTKCQTFADSIKSLSISHYFAAGIILLLFGIIIENTHHLFGIFISEIGIAFIVSAVIGLSIEEKHKKSFSEFAQQQLENFKNNTFQTLFGWNVPKIYIQLIQDQITELNFYRSHLELEFILHDINSFPGFKNMNFPNANDFIFLESRFKYIVKNIRTSDQNYFFTFTLDKDAFPEHNHVHSILIETDDFIKLFSNEEIERHKQQESDQNTIESKYKLNEICIKPDKTLRAEIISYTPRLKIYNRETFDTFFFTENITVTATNFTEDFCITCDTSTESNMKSSKILNSIRWKSTKPLLPKQSITFRWSNLPNARPSSLP